MARIAEAGSYDNTARQFELTAHCRLAGDTWHQRTVIQPISDTMMVATSYLRFAAVPECRAVEIMYTRKMP